MDEAFADRWNRKLVACGFDDVGISMVPCGAEVLPGSAAPCLRFEVADQPTPIWEVFGIPAHWSEAERERLAAYRVIGSDGAGNPICIEQGTWAVVLLDHEDWFHAQQFVNSSVRQLAECLLAYLGEKDPRSFRAVVQEVDPAALAEGSFWWHEAMGLGV